MTPADAARNLGVTRKALSEFVNQRAGLRPAMAVRIAAAAGTSPESWLNMQMKLDLWKALQGKPQNIKEFPRIGEM